MKNIFIFAETIPTMAKSTKTKRSKKKMPFLVNVDPVILERVRKHKEKTGVQIGKFYDLAVTEKLEAEGG